MSRIRRNELVISSPIAKTADSDPREDLAIVIDRSGSMTCSFSNADVKSRIQAAYEAAVAIVSTSSDETTRFTVVTFESNPRLHCAHVDMFTAMCNLQFDPGGSTDMGGGLATALAQGVNRIVLLTDGCADYREDVLRQADTAAALKVKIDTVGIGEGDDELLKEISKRTGGLWSHPATPAELVARFAQLETTARLAIEHMVER